MSEGAFGEPNRPAADARYVLIPVPYERTATYRKGTADGPAALLAASAQVELFDAETRMLPAEAGICLLDPVAADGMPDELADRLTEVVGPHLEAGRVVGCLGGEHSISLGAIRAAAARYPGLGILQIDAHPDLRDEYEGTRFGHGCVMRRVLEADIGKLVQVGLRAVSDEDDSVIGADERIHALYAHELAGRDVEDVVDLLPEHIYISFDLDGLDPSVVPGTGTPEPGGLGWWDALGVLRAAISRRTLVGFDIVELLPAPPSVVSDFAAAKLLFKILAYDAARSLR